MKGIFKLIPAALAVFALASCSTDELEGSMSQEQAVANKGDLRITFDPFDNETSTRALRNDNFGQLTFVEGDQVNVYSEDLYKTDWYKFDEAESAFMYNSEGEKMVDNPKFGVMPGEAVRKAYIDRASRTTRVDMEILPVITYGEEAQLEDGTNMYACNLPAFGYASLNEEGGYVEVAKLRYMVGILKINLEKAVSNVSYLRLINYGQGANPTGHGGTQFQHGFDASDIAPTAKPLSGQLTAALAKDDADRKDVKLEVLDPTLPTYPYLIIDLRTVTANKSVVYIPVVPGLDGDLDNIRLEYTNNLNDNPEGFAAADWEPIPGMTFAGKEFKQHSRYSGGHAFEFADMSPYLVSTILDQYQTTADDIDIEIANSFTIKSTDAQIDNVIKLPAFENDVDVNISLKDAFPAATATTGWINADDENLIITDADPENPFTGKVTININGNGGKIAAAKANITVNLAEGTAVIVGDFDNASALTLTSGNIEIGDGTNTTSGITWPAVADDIQSIKIAENATITNAIDCHLATNNTKSIIVAGDLTGDIAASPSPNAAAKSTVEVSGKVTGNITGVGCIFTDVNISGTVVGAITLEEAVKGNLTITSGDAADPDAKFVTGNVTTKGNVEIALSAEGEAVAGTLKMTGAAKTLTLKQGYVKEIEVAVTDAGSWEEKYINVMLDKPLTGTTYGKTAFLTLKETEGIAKFTKSTWNGQKINNATYKDKQTTAYGTNTCIFTASQFASFAGIGNDATLNNNIDLNDQPWTGYPQKGKFQAAKVVDQDDAEDTYATISKLNLKDLGADKNNGLFTNNTGASSVYNLTINGAKGTFTNDQTKGIGVIYGTAANAAEFNNVTISDIDIKNSNTAKKMTGVGALVGIATAAIDATDVTVAGSIDGYSCLGGFVGTTSKAATFDGCDASAITFKQTFNSGKTMDIDYATIGGFVGNVSADVAVTITDGVAPASINYEKTSKMYVSDTSSETGNFYTYHPLQYFIGFSGNNNSATTIAISSINGTKYCAAKGWGIANNKTVETDIDHGTGASYHKYLYSWPAKPAN